jgi:GPH family glycoside/pentoside/hexuronide:cation symporter
MLGFFFIPADAFGWMLAINALGSFLGGPTPALVWSIYTDVADYGEWKFERRCTGLVFSAAMFAQKMGLTIGGGLSGIMLSFFGFVPNAEQTPDSSMGIRFMFSILPGILGIANALVLLAYPLTEKTIMIMQRELHERRSKH